MCTIPRGAQPGTKAQADTEFLGGTKSLTTGHLKRSHPRENVALRSVFSKSTRGQGDTRPCAGHFASIVVRTLDERPGSAAPASAVIDARGPLLDIRGRCRFLRKMRVGAHRRRFAIHRGTLARRRGAFDCAHRERYSLVLRRSQSVTIFVGSTASLSICISTTLPLLSIR